jgi:hypothetical protein
MLLDFTFVIIELLGCEDVLGCLELIQVGRWRRLENLLSATTNQGCQMVHFAYQKICIWCVLEGLEW